MFNHCFISIFLVAGLVGGNDSKIEVEIDDRWSIQDTEAEAEPKESAVLKQEMIDASVELFRQKDPDVDASEVSLQVEKAILQIRKHDPKFLIVTEVSEAVLKSGKSLQGAAERIAKAETFFLEFEIRMSGLAASLLSKHKSGKLEPTRTELLAQILIADVKKTQKALSK